MATATHTTLASAIAHLDIAGAYGALVQGLKNRRAYRKTVTELSMLSDANLADLGLSRNDIDVTATRIIYGARS